MAKNETQILEGLFHTSQEIAIKWEAEAKPALRGLNNGVDTGACPSMCVCLVM
jgi:hypothetical protein